MQLQLLVKNPQAQNILAVVGSVTGKSALLQCGVEFSGAPAKVVCSAAESTVCREQLAGLFLQAITSLTALIEEVGHPVIVGLIPRNGLLDTLRRIQLVVVADSFLSAFYLADNHT